MADTLAPFFRLAHISMLGQEVLIPGSFLRPQEPGKQHGTITKIKTRDGPPIMAVVSLTDFAKVKVTLPLEEAMSYALEPLPRTTPTTATTATQAAAAASDAAATGTQQRELGVHPPAPIPPSSSSSSPSSTPTTPTTPPPHSQAAALPSPPGPPPPLSPPRSSPQSPSLARSGPGLVARLAAAAARPRAAPGSPGHRFSVSPPGTRVWVLLRGKLGLKDVAAAAARGSTAVAAAATPVAWPAVLFDFTRVPKADVPLLLQTASRSSPSSSSPHQNNSSSRALVLFYGERSLSWTRLADLEPWFGFSGKTSAFDDDDKDENQEEGEEVGKQRASTFVASRLEALRASSSAPRVARRVAAAAKDAIDEALTTLDDPVAELSRAAEARAAGALAAANGGGVATTETEAAAAAEREQNNADNGGDDDPNVYCSRCSETISVAEERSGTCVRCERCGAGTHCLCLSPFPALKCSDLSVGSWFDCPGCGLKSAVKSSAPAAAAGGRRKGDRGKAAPPATKKKRTSPTSSSEERMGLTPDRIIEGAIRVFGLEPPTPEVPFVRGLCDPASNSMRSPNIPAETLYDKSLNGLLLSNPWRGFVLLNPEFSSSVAHRFVARAQDEVENGTVKACILVCRNSTDTKYFQRLRPYPRIHLLRSSIMFKDYENTPIGFGIVLFLMVRVPSSPPASSPPTGPGQDPMQMIYRFYEEFQGLGEPNIPYDEEHLRSPSFSSLLRRLRARSDADARQKQHWVQCVECAKWRIVESYEEASAARSVDWSCSSLNESRGKRRKGDEVEGDDGDEEERASDGEELPLITCDTPQSREELGGVHYATRAAVEGAVARGCGLGTQIGDGPVQRQGEGGGGGDGGGAGGGGGGSGGRDGAAAEELEEEQEAAAPETTSEAKTTTAAGAAAVAPGKEPSGEGSYLTALELARQARIAANKAFFSALGSSKATAASDGGGGGEGEGGSDENGKKNKKRRKGSPRPPAPPSSLQRDFLPAEHPSIAEAARELALRAARETAAAQVAAARARHAAGIARRAARVDELRSRLGAAEAEAERAEAEEAAEVEAAERVARDVGCSEVA